MTAPAITTATHRLRPETLDDYVGQERLKAELRVYTTVALQEAAMMPPLFLDGPPGCGKTTLAFLLAKEIACEDYFLSLVMPLKEDDWEKLDGFVGVLFLDEIHRSSKDELELFLQVIDDGIMRPKGRPEMLFRRISLICATTEEEVVRQRCPALLDRMSVWPHYADYSDAEITLIITGMARKLDVTMDADNLAILGHAASGQPREAQHLVTAAQNLQKASHRPVTAMEVLDMKNLTIDGLGANQVMYLRLMRAYNQALGIETLKQLIPGRKEAWIREVERPLLRLGLIKLTGNGRAITGDGKQRVAELNQTERISASA